MELPDVAGARSGRDPLELGESHQEIHALDPPLLLLCVATPPAQSLAAPLAGRRRAAHKLLRPERIELGGRDVGAERAVYRMQDVVDGDVPPVTGRHDDRPREVWCGEGEGA